MSQGRGPRARSRIRALRVEVRAHGLRAGVPYLTQRVRGYTAYRWHLVNEWRMDRAFGIETRRVIDLDALDLSSARHRESVLYQATPYPAIRKAIDALPIGAKDAYTFVDVGCGKGRALVVAAAAGFGRVVGVELDPELAATARDNLARATRRGAIASATEVVATDASGLVPPDGPLVIYLHNPFGVETLRDVVSALDSSWADDPRHILVVYYNPVHDDLFTSGPWDIVERHPSDGFNVYEHQGAGEALPSPEGTSG